MQTQPTRWIALVDGRRARFFQCAKTHRDSWRVEEDTESLRNQWEDSREKHRPSILGRASATAPAQSASFGHDEEEDQRRFADDVVQWLTPRLERLGDAPLLVFASARFLGTLRKRVPDAMQRRMRLTELQLTRLTPGEIAAHPTVVAALDEEPVVTE